MNEKLRGLLYVTTFSLVWAIQTIINKFAVNKGLDPMLFSFQTLIGAGFFLLIYVTFTQFKELKKIKKASTKELVLIVLVGVLASGLATLSTFYGLKYSTSINYGFLVKTTVVFSVLLAAIFLKEKLTIKK